TAYATPSLHDALPLYGRAGTSFPRQVRLGQIRRRSAQHLVLLFQQPDPAASSLEILVLRRRRAGADAVLDIGGAEPVRQTRLGRSEEHTSELQSREHL